MRALIQRVSRAEVRIGGETAGRIGPGMLVLVGVGKQDTPAAGRALAEKIAHLRIFADDQGKMNRSLVETGGGALVVSQFTLYADCRRGRRPSYGEAAGAAQAEPLYEGFVQSLRDLLGSERVKTGRFQAMMEVELVNDGPVTLLVDSDPLS